MEYALDLTIRNELGQVSYVADRLAPLLEIWRVAPNIAYRVQLVLEEVLSNVVRHAFPDGGVHAISVLVAFDGEGIDIRVRDDGIEFDPSAAPDVDVTLPLELRRVGGLGLHFVRQLTRYFEYRREDGFNDLWLRV